MFTGKKLEQAIRQDNAQGNVTMLAQQVSRNNYRKICGLAVEYNAANALKALFATGRGFDFTSSSYADQQFTGELIRTSETSPVAALLLTQLFETNQTTIYGSIDNACFLNARTPPEVIQLCLERRPDLFAAAIKKIGMDSTEKLAFILSFTSRAPKAQETLDEVLAQIAAKGEVEKARLLLERRANPNFNNGRPLLYAAQNGFRDMVDLLLPKTNPAFLNDISIQLSLKEVPQDIIDALRNAPRNEKQALVQAAIKSADVLNIHANDVALTKTRTLPDGSTLQLLFDFSLRQQFSLATTPQGTTTLTVTSFDDLPKGLEEALREESTARNDKSPHKLRTTIRTV